MTINTLDKLLEFVAVEEMLIDELLQFDSLVTHTNDKLQTLEVVAAEELNDLLEE